MALNITVENSCKFLVIRGRQYDPTSTQGEINITDLDTNATTTHIMAWDVNGRGRINVPTDSIPAKYGAFKVCLEELGIEYACKPILIHCDIDCCLVKLTNELLDCACDCPKCATTLAKAQKVFLLLKSANTAVEIAGTDINNTGYYIDILEKYKKAKEICDNSCGCEC